MIINEKFIEQLMKSAIDITSVISKLSSTQKVEELIRLGENGQNVKALVNGSWCYSFEPKEDLAKRIPEQESSAEIETKKIHKAKMDFMRLYNLVWEGELKKQLPEEQFQMIQDISKKGLNSNSLVEVSASNDFISKVYYALGRQKERNVMETTVMYQGIAKTAEERLSHPAIYFIAKSNVAEYYRYGMRKDIAEVYGEDAAENYDEVISKIVKKHEKTLKASCVQMGEGGPSNS